MAPELRWDDTEDIAIALTDKFPEVNPLEVRFTDLHRYVTELPIFVDDPKASNESKLEKIQMAWHEEWEDRTQPPS
jgi:FeS assembly protein IscX